MLKLERGLSPLHEEPPAAREMPTLRPGEVYGFIDHPTLPADAAGFLAAMSTEDMRPGISMLVDLCHGASLRAGWWHDLDGNPLTDPILVSNKLMLTVSELAEAMEADRKGLMDDKIAYRPGIEVELADAVIRIFDLVGALGLDLPGAIFDKMEFNARRADHKPENRKAAGGKAY